MESVVPPVLGPLVVATCVNTFIYGICFVQYYNYYTLGFRDNRWIRMVVGFLAIVDSVFTATTIYGLWQYTVVHYADPLFLRQAPWHFTWAPMITSSASVLVQHFLAYRIRLFTKSWIYFGIVSFLSFSQFALGYTCSIRAFFIHDSSKFASMTPLVDTWLVVGVVCDSLLSFLLSYSLIRVRTGYKDTDHLIYRIVRISIETAAFCTMATIAALLTFTLAPLTNTYVVFAFPMGRIYTNTLLTTLNARAEQKQGSTHYSTHGASSHHPSVSGIKFNKDYRGITALHSGIGPEAEASYTQTIHKYPVHQSVDLNLHPHRVTAHSHPGLDSQTDVDASDLKIADPTGSLEGVYDVGDIEMQRRRPGQVRVDVRVETDGHNGLKP